MEFGMKLRITYVLDWEVLAITYWDSFLTLVRCLRAEIVGIGNYVVYGPCVNKPCFCILCMLKIRCTGHYSKVCDWILSLIRKVHPMIVVNSIVPHLPIDLAGRPFCFGLWCRLKLCRLKLLLLRLRLSEVWSASSWWSSTFPSTVIISASSSIKTLVVVEASSRFVMRNKHG